MRAIYLRFTLTAVQVHTYDYNIYIYIIYLSTYVYTCVDFWVQMVSMSVQVIDSTSAKSYV